MKFKNISNSVRFQYRIIRTIFEINRNHLSTPINIIAILEKESGCINWNIGQKWTNQNFLVKYIIILVKLTRILIKLIKIYWFVHFQLEIFLSIVRLENFLSNFDFFF